MTPHQFLKFSATYKPTLKFKYCIIQDNKENEERLATCFDKIKTRKRIYEFHEVIPISETQIATYSENKLQTPVISSSVIGESEKIKPGFCGGFLGKNNETNVVEVSFLYPRGPEALFFHPQPT